MGARLPWASRTALAMRPRAETAPIPVALSETAPRPLIEPAKTFSPGPRSTGKLSPVRCDSSRAVSPFMIVPSTGTRSPGRTTTSWPGLTSARGTSTSWPMRTTRAVSGASSSRARTASPARARARASIQRPSRTKAVIMAAACTWSFAPPNQSGRKSPRAPAPQATTVPRPTRVFMSGARSMAARKPRRKMSRPARKTIGAAITGPTHSGACSGWAASSSTVPALAQAKPSRLRVSSSRAVSSPKRTASSRVPAPSGPSGTPKPARARSLARRASSTGSSVRARFAVREPKLTSARWMPGTLARMRSTLPAQAWQVMPLMGSCSRRAELAESGVRASVDIVGDLMRA